MYLSCSLFPLRIPLYIFQIIYVSDILSKIYEDMGRFDIAEEYLLGAYTKLPKRQRITSNLSAFKLQFSLAKLYLKGFYYERGIKLLENLLRLPHPRGKRSNIVFSLAEGYIKKRNYEECARLLRQVDIELGESTTLPKSSHHPYQFHSRTPGSGGATNITSTATPTGSAGGGRGNYTTSVFGSIPKKTVHELAARNFLHARKYLDAIKSIDALIKSCSRSNFNLLGNYFYLRGKIFHTILSPGEETPEFPVELMPSKVFYAITDVLQEAVASYRKSFKYFSSIGDDFRKCKSASKIGECYLDYLFTKITLENQSFESLAIFSKFEVSPILTRSNMGPLRQSNSLNSPITSYDSNASTQSPTNTNSNLSASNNSSSPNTSLSNPIGGQGSTSNTNVSTILTNDKGDANTTTTTTNNTTTGVPGGSKK